MMVLLPTGRRHAIPRAATNLECLVEVALPASPLPAISIRTILPLARLVQQLKQAKEESHAGQTASTIHSTELCSPIPMTLRHRLPLSSQQQLAHLAALCSFCMHYRFSEALSRSNWPSTTFLFRCTTTPITRTRRASTARYPSCGAGLP
ncbi:hypothetical protein [Ktedonobacter sp. SOSP1-52]|uniref:hypothetical protein n=1 Tax=Ktedonobacter sp. SOSP1-52 TaxID=2778366 RepID=UPI00191538FE|nr:hypothetical protein [Ktedonobacter sp. SOSP1-52]